ncbi:AMP-binding protein [Companilactobacillus jidongensis]|uniref:AMP-binding protein n=1 Tax=Companilactobacillus jidongensis TaxID=2486006 RepID=UPI000F77FA59|nr:AMP-binding protein [Companilactobacillus jidongensis]
MSKLTTQLKQQLTNNPTRPIMQDAEKHWYTGSELNEERETWLQYFQNQGIGYNDVVLVALNNSVTYSLVTQTLWEIGAIVHPINPAVTEIQLSEFEEQYNYSAMILNSDIEEPDTLETTFEKRPKLTTLHETEVELYIRKIHEAHLAKEPFDNQFAVIMHTSGTTGKPKRVGLTHEQLFANANNIIDSEDLTDFDRTMIVMPLFHVNAMVISNLATRLSDGQLIFRPKFSAHLFWKEVFDEQLTWVSLTPAIIEILLQRDEQPKSNKLRFLRTASAPLLPSTHEEFRYRFDIPLIESYGMTEAASQIAQNPLNAPKQNSVGLTYGTDVKILDGNLNELDVNEVGEIAVKGESVIDHYLDPQPETFSDGYLLTGDLGKIDSDGYLFIVGRRKEMIIRGGENVNPLAVEDCLKVLTFIKEIAVIGTPDKIFGEAVTAVIITNDNQTDHRYQLALLKNLANNQLMPAERPTEYIFGQSLPKNATGKVQRNLLAKEIEENQYIKEA